MPMVGSGNRDGVDILPLENRAKVFVRRRGLARLALHGVSELSENVAVHIRDMRDACSAQVRFERGEMGVPAPIQPNHSKVEAIIGAEDLAITLCRRSHGQPRCAHCKSIDEFTSRNAKRHIGSSYAVTTKCINSCLIRESRSLTNG